jgi:hypothetical protein
MNASMNRRGFCCGLLGFGIVSFTAELSATAKVRPFCRFSLRDGWSDDGPAEYITRKASLNDTSGVPQVVEQIKMKLAIRASFDVYIAAQEDNAFATVANGRKILVVDVGFLEKLNRIARTEWGAIQVIAHEIGHHIAGFSANRHRSELNADYWSGQSLQRLGSAKAAATSAILTVGTEMDTPSHPNKHRRAATIERGWDDAAQDRIDYAFCDDCR